MKKIVLLLSSVLFLSANAQNSIALFTGTTNNAIAANSVIQLTVNAGTNKKFDIDLKNVSSNTNTYTVTRYNVLLNSNQTSTATAYYCFAGSCYDDQITISPNSLVLRAGKRASDTTLVDTTAGFYMLTTDLDEASVAGKSIIKYSFKNIAIPADSQQVVLSYNGAIVGLNAVEKEVLGFSIFPNPAKDKIDLKLNTSKTILSKLSVYNALGSVVKEKEVLLVEGKNNISFDVQDLPTGIYFAKVTYGNNSDTRKFVVE